MKDHGKIYVCAGCRVPAPLMFRIDGDRTMCPDCVKNRIAELEAAIARVRAVAGRYSHELCLQQYTVDAEVADEINEALTPTPEAP